MTTLAPQALAPTPGAVEASHPLRSAVRSVVVLVTALGLTGGVLVALASVVEGWSST